VLYNSELRYLSFTRSELCAMQYQLDCAILHNEAFRGSLWQIKAQVSSRRSFITLTTGLLQQLHRCPHHGRTDRAAHLQAQPATEEGFQRAGRKLLFESEGAKTRDFADMKSAIEPKLL